jgi:hypothetical protein
VIKKQNPKTFFRRQRSAFTAEKKKKKIYPQSLSVNNFLPFKGGVGGFSQSGPKQIPQCPPEAVKKFV